MQSDDADRCLGQSGTPQICTCLWRMISAAVANKPAEGISQSTAGADIVSEEQRWLGTSGGCTSHLGGANSA